MKIIDAFLARIRRLAGLVALARKEPRRPGLARGRLIEAFFAPLPAEELAAWQQ